MTTGIDVRDWDDDAGAEQAARAAPHRTVPFGKYRDQPAERMAADTGYCRWLLAQPWFGASYPGLRTWLTSQGAGSARSAVPAARYDYRHQDGTLAYTVVRYQPKDFSIEAPDGTPMENPVAPETAVLYRLPELLAAPPGATVHVCEGERDCETLACLGLVATTNPCGTRMGWLDSYTPYLAGRHAVVLPDADGPGRRHAATVLDAIAGTASSAVVCDLHAPGRGPWDVTDWMATRSAAGLAGRVGRARMEAAGYTWRPGGPVKAGREEILWASALDPTAKLVLAALMWLARDGGGTPAASQLAARTSLHRVTVQNTLTRLRGLGVLDGSQVDWPLLAVARF
ncbi:MAG: helix-turn-helix domain-containing protein [Streptosporangiaceae bacterium]